MAAQRGGNDGDRDDGDDAGRDSATSLAVALFDLAWLLPRTVGGEARQTRPLPRSELEVMRWLGRRPGAGVNAIATDLGLKASNVSATVRSLEAKGLLERRRPDGDRRQAPLHLTAEATRERRQREVQWGNDLRDTLAALPANRQRALHDAIPALQALAQVLADGTPTGP